MQALITGGAGFIGSHLAQRLLDAGQSVCVIDNLSTGCLDNIEALRNNSRFEFHQGDIRDNHLMDRLAAKCDVIYHLAAAVGVQLIADSPVHTIETNIAGTQVALEAANKYRRKILLASSSEVYGKNEQVPFREDDDIVLGSTVLSRWSYACSKAIDEFLGLAFHQEHGIEVVIGRFFNTIGPRQSGRYGMVVPRFIHWALANEPVLVYGTGKQRRCFCYVEDLVEAVTGLMNCPAATGKVFNIGSTEEIEIGSLADLVIRVTGSRSKKEFVAYEEAYGRPIEDMARRVPCLERIKQITGWQPKTSLEEMLRITIESLRAAGAARK